jgi:DinB superfamily
MSTKQDLIEGMSGVVVEAKRVSKLLDDQGDWDVKRPAGWTPKEMFSHIASVSEQIATTGPGLLGAPEDFDFTASTNVTEMNAKVVAAMANKSPQELTQAIIANFGKLGAWVETLSDEQLSTPKTFAQMKMPVSDMLGNIAILHAHHHMFEAAIRTAF